MTPTPLEIKHLFLGDKPQLELISKSPVFEGRVYTQRVSAFRLEPFAQIHLNYTDCSSLEGRVFTKSPYGLYVLETNGNYNLSSGNHDLVDGATRVIDTEFNNKKLTSLFNEISKLQPGSKAQELFNIFLRDYYGPPILPMDNQQATILSLGGFLAGTVLRDKTSILEQGNTQVQPYDLPGKFVNIGIGSDYRGLQLPPGTEVVKLITLPGVGQIIQYMHRAKDKEGKEEMAVMSSEFRMEGKELKLETILHE